MLDSVVFLTGSVPSRMAKYHAENLAAQIPGVTDVENLLQVVSRKSRPHDPRA
jgi:osmotically-inducible protein OsmY